MMNLDHLNCDLYNNGLCSSCSWINKPYQQQTDEKQLILHSTLSSFITQETLILPPETSDLQKFRYKAKMVVSGQVENLQFGILNTDLQGVDLTECPLYSYGIKQIFEPIKKFILKVGLSPYNMTTRKGKLKYLLITESFATQQLMIRFVLNDETKIESMRSHLDSLINDIPKLCVVSANIQSIHQAILEGDKEIILSSQTSLEEIFNGIPLFIKPKSFFQTNPKLAEKLYDAAGKLALTIQPKIVWDLFCGVGGFGLTIANYLSIHKSPTSLVGIEIEPNAIESATKSAIKLNLEDYSFKSLDSTLFATTVDDTQLPQLLVVNPPRRGLGKNLCHYINQSNIPHVFYSSCALNSLQTDLELLHNYEVKSLQLFDFFAHTSHFEIFVSLKLKNSAI